jgi:hypothetical protein
MPALGFGQRKGTMTPRHDRTIAAVAFAVLFLNSHVGSAIAHDLWLVPDEPARGEKLLSLYANSGVEFPLSEYALDPAAFRRHILIRPDGTEGVLRPRGTKEKSGLLQFEQQGSGAYLAAVATRPKLLTLPPDEFNRYLVSDGLPHIYHLRAREKTLDRPGRERYSKYPKALVWCGTGGKGDPCRVLGLLLEIVPLRDPSTLKVGDTLGVRVLFRGKPLADANLGWHLPGDGEVPRGTVRTDARGEALVPIARTGLMTIRLTHMTRPRAKDYEWESFWTTLTFRLAR